MDYLFFIRVALNLGLHMNMIFFISSPLPTKTSEREYGAARTLGSGFQDTAMLQWIGRCLCSKFFL